MANAVNLLQLSPTMTEGTIVKWLVKEGDAVTSGKPIAEVETDKAVMEQESFFDGKILKLVAKEGDKVAVESLIAVIGEEGEDVSAMVGAGNGNKGAKKAAPAEPAKAAAPTVAFPPAASVPSTAQSESADGGRKLASPLARKIAQDAGLDLGRISGSGPHGRVIKRDIDQAVASGSAPTAAASEAPSRPAAAPVYTYAVADEQIKLSGMRQTIARRLTESKQFVPHFQLTVDVRGEKLLEAVASIKESNPDAKVTVTHFLIKAMAMVALRHKAIRSQWAGDHLKVIGAAHISVAVAIEDGLVTPVLRNVQTKGVLQIAQELRDLAGLARARKLTAEDMSGGVQTLSNLGMYGIDNFSAIINPPESSILAVGGMQERPVVENGQLVVGKVMSITMSCDHRVIDGAVGAQYLQDLKRTLEQPVLMLL
jgi:pyruvate dehydrogenase E2 component (dihydrolipoamide acetyltransferase)